MSDHSIENIPQSTYSYHTFIFPFIWNNSGKLSRKDFKKCIHPYWVPDFRKDTPFDTSLYTQYAYFNPAARSAIFTEAGEKNPIVSNYRFDMQKLSDDTDWSDSLKGHDNPVQYVIRKGDFIAALRVNNLRLRLFSTGVGMIVFELENNEYNDEKSINRINEYGRRCFMPFVDSDGSCSICADDITLRYPGGAIVSSISGQLPRANNDIRFMELIMYLLRNETYAAVTSPSADPNQFHIEPIIDDRMFVACLWCNNAFALEMNQFTDKGYCYLADALEKQPNDPSSAARRLYELLFVDGTNLSCRSRTMLRDMLEKHVYHRWLEYSTEYGTITGISEFSFLTVTSDPISKNAHLTEYVEMVMFVLAQRATLLSFERQISDCARGKRSVNKIQKAYVHFQSKYLLREVTPQQQGIELYHMLCRHLFIGDLTRDVEGQIRALFSLAQNTVNTKNYILFSLITLLNFANIGDFITLPNWISPLGAAIALLAVLVMLFFFNRRDYIK